MSGERGARISGELVGIRRVGYRLVEVADMGRYDAVLECLALRGGAYRAGGKHDRADECDSAIRLLEAAGKVDKKASIDALQGIFNFAAIHGINTPDPDVIAAMALLEALPD